MIGFVFVIAFILSMLSGIPFLYSLLNALIWSVIAAVAGFLLSLVFGAGLLAFMGISSLFHRTPRDSTMAGYFEEGERKR